MQGVGKGEVVGDFLKWVRARCGLEFFFDGRKWEKIKGIKGRLKFQETADKLSIMPVNERSLQNLTGGSRLGRQNKATLALKEAIEHAFDELGGTSYLVHVGRNDPRTFCALLSKLLPTKLANADGSPLLAALTELTDAQLEARTARALADAQRAGLMAPPDGGSSAQVLEVQAEVVQPVEENTRDSNQC